MTYIVVPTVGRMESLIKLIKSIDMYIPLVVLYDFDYKGSVYSRNLATKHLKGNIIYVTDDIEFTKGCLKKALDDLHKHFPDTDGVIGFTQDHQHHPSGVALIGAKFVNRYPDSILFSPKYHHFAAQEVYDYSNKLKKFYKSDALIKHSQNFSDKTSQMARQKKKEDQELYAERQNRGDVFPLA